MKQALVKSWAPPKSLMPFFGDPPLALNEKREDYDNLLGAIAAAVKPADAIAWLLVRDIADLSWEIRRERGLKQQFIKAAEISAVAQLLRPPKSGFVLDLDLMPFDPNPVSDEASEAAKEWAHDAKARRRIDKQLEDAGYESADILFEALKNRNSEIEAFDRRLATYELRRMAALRACEQYSPKFSRLLEKASSEIIEGEFTEAAE